MLILSGVGLAGFWDWQDFLDDCYGDIIWSRIGRILGLAGFFPLTTAPIFINPVAAKSPGCAGQ
jgi:hypothetical protein